MPPSAIPGPGKSACELVDSIGTDGGVRALLVVGSNPAVSMPDGSNVKERLAALDLLVVSDFFLSETAELADIVLPAAQWAEEDGTMTNLEGRVILRRRATVAGRRADQSTCSLRWRRPSAERAHRARPPVTCSTSCAGRLAARRPTAGITYERIDAEDGSSGRARRTIQGRRASSPTFRPRAAGPASTASHQAPVDDLDAAHPLR